MKMNRLGRTEFNVSAIGLGGGQYTGEFGIHPDIAGELLDYAMQSNINIFDTAQMYNFGEGEELVGRAAFKYPEKKAILSTKIGYMDIALSRMKGREAYIDPVEIRRCIKHSLWLLRRDALDICQIHEVDWPQWELDYETGNSVILNTLEDLKKEGLIKNIGLGTWKYDVAAKLVRTDRIDMVLSAGGMDILSDPISEKLIPASKEHDVGLILGSCFGANSSYLTNKDQKKLRSLQESDDELKQNTAKKLTMIYKLADELNMDMFEITIRYLMAMEDIHCLMLGARELRHVQDNVSYAEKGPLSQEIVNEIQKIRQIYPSLTPHQIKHLNGGAAPVLDLIK